MTYGMYCSVSVPSVGLEDDLLISFGNFLETGFPKVTLAALRTSAAGRCYTSNAQLECPHQARQPGHEARSARNPLSCCSSLLNFCERTLQSTVTYGGLLRLFMGVHAAIASHCCRLSDAEMAREGSYAEVLLCSPIPLSTAGVLARSGSSLEASGFQPGCLGTLTLGLRGVSSSMDRCISTHLRACTGLPNLPGPCSFKLQELHLRPGVSTCMSYGHTSPAERQCALPGQCSQHFQSMRRVLCTGEA